MCKQIYGHSCLRSVFNSVCLYGNDYQKIQEEIQENEMLLEKLRVRKKEAEAKTKDLKVSFENLCGTEALILFLAFRFFMSFFFFFFHIY